jgi:phospholipid/cholesterol/gamma-HCH transport system substrate-binding protein
MQHSKSVDILVGLFVASGIGALFFLALQVSNLSSYISDNNYLLTARFDNSGGLKVKSAITMAGVRIGQVSAIRFDKETYESIVEMKIEAQYDTLPDDTSASILTAGLLGEQYIGLLPGFSEVYLQDSDEISMTQSAFILENIIGKLLYSIQNDK